MRWLDLFSGIGAYALGLEQAGHEVIGFCENDPWARKILKKHWPTKPISWCVKSFRKALVESLVDSHAKTSVSLENAKGYNGTPPEKPQPVQDSSGEATTRSGLFWEMARIVRMVRPKYWLMENVAELLDGHLGVILREVAACGYDAEWDCVAASTVGAPHHRGRAYILAHPAGSGRGRLFPEKIQRQPEFQGYENCRAVEDIVRMSGVSQPIVCRGDNGIAKRLHSIGNANPPCVIRELTRGLKEQHDE